jgi:hypothetical protein
VIRALVVLGLLILSFLIAAAVFWAMEEIEKGDPLPAVDAARARAENEILAGFVLALCLLAFLG